MWRRSARSTPVRGSWPRSTSGPLASSWQRVGTSHTDGSVCTSCTRSSAVAGSGSSSSARRLRGSRPAVWDWTGTPGSRRTTVARVSWTSTPTRDGGARLACCVPVAETARSSTRASSRSSHSSIWTHEPSVLRDPSSSERGWPSLRLVMWPSFETGTSRDSPRRGRRAKAWKIGPLYAPDASGAAALLAAVTRGPRSRRRVLARHTEPERRGEGLDGELRRHQGADIRSDGSRRRSSRRHLRHVRAAGPRSRLTQKVLRLMPSNRHEGDRDAGSVHVHPAEHHLSEGHDASCALSISGSWLTSTPVRPPSRNGCCTRPESSTTRPRR